MVDWTEVQRQRLSELGAEPEKLKLTFRDVSERNISYQKIEKELVSRNKERLIQFGQEIRKPAIKMLEERLANKLVKSGFTQVSTPILLSKGLLAKMTITEDHQLNDQVFWVDERKCLRPMLAPNLYFVLKDLLRLWPHPVSIFEIGPCFRRDTQGGEHLQEFTMLNLVEMGLPHEQCVSRLSILADLVMKEAGISGFCLEKEDSVVYGETTDIVAGGLELGSAAIGPLALDHHWGIDVPWVGIGFGLERLVMYREGFNNIQKAGSSLSYLNGIRLNIQG